MSAIDINIPFFHNGRMAFHVRLHQYDYYGIWQYEINSTLPEELLLISCGELKRKGQMSTISVAQSFLLVNKIGKAVLNNSISSYFYYPQYLLDDQNTLNEEHSKKLMTHMAGHELIRGLSATVRDYPELLFLFQSNLFIGYFFYFEEFHQLTSRLTKNQFLECCAVGCSDTELSLQSFWKFENENLTVYYSTKNRTHLCQMTVVRSKS